MSGDEISEEGRRQRFERWEQLGLDQVKADLLQGGHRVVGGPPQVRALAWDWVRIKEAEKQGISLSPGAARAFGSDPAHSPLVMKAAGITKASTVGENLQLLISRLRVSEVTMNDAEIRGRLLTHFHDLRHNNGGWVPISESILAPEPVELRMIGGVCQQLADVRLIQWRPLQGSDGIAAGMAKITGQGVAAVESGRSADIDIRFPPNKETVRASGASSSLAETARALGVSPSTEDTARALGIEISAKQGVITSMPPVMSIDRRRHVLASTLMLKALGHTGFDRMLLEFGVPEDVGTGSGLAARANSLARYVLSNPDAKAYDGSSINDAIIKRARDLYERGFTNNVTDQERDEYSEARANDERTSGPSDAPLVQRTAEQITEKSPESQLIADAHVVRKKPRRKVFIVHGHDAAPREAVARFLQALDFEPIILHERPNKGRTIITKFQEEAVDVGFAIVLITPDDIGGNLSSGQMPRARQNVIFELGFFIGILGPDRVAALVKGDVEKPSDFDGVVYTALDDQGAWKQAVARELKAAGFEVDFNKLLSP